MTNRLKPLDILLSLKKAVAPNISDDLVRNIFLAEERVQFDDDRREVNQKIKNLIQAEVEKHYLEQEG